MKAEQLEVLFGSRVKVKLLKIFLESPEDWFHGRRLARLIEEEHKGVWLELRDLDNADILISKTEGKTKKYQLKKFSGWQILAQFLLHPESSPSRKEPQTLLLYYLFLLVIAKQEKIP